MYGVTRGRFLEQEAGNEADEGERLNEGDTQEHGGAQLAGHLGLTSHALDGLADEHADTDAGADGKGGADDVVLYTATISAPRLMPIHAFIPTLGSTIEYTLETAVKNQPYDRQGTPAVICG